MSEYSHVVRYDGSREARFGQSKVYPDMCSALLNADGFLPWDGG